MFKTYQLADLPQDIPLFPLSGVVLLPQFYLPLNVFEPRYMAMVDDALARERLIGMVQMRDAVSDAPPLYNIGCAGRITSFEETTDGRYIINLTGICRFKIIQEIPVAHDYRRATVDWSSYAADLGRDEKFKLDRKIFLPLLETYFEKQEFEIDWQAIERSNDVQLINTLAMVCPLDTAEKQALLEADTITSRADMLQALLSIATGADDALRRLH